MPLLDVEHSYTFIVHCIMGELYNDVEQTSDSVRSYHVALQELSNVNPLETWKFYQYLIVIYNNLGLSYLNRDENEMGLGCLAKAEEVYNAFREVPGDDFYHNRAFEANGRQFRFLFEGGIDH